MRFHISYKLEQHSIIFYQELLKNVFIDEILKILKRFQTGYSTIAQYERYGTKRALIFDGHRFHKNRQTEKSTHWVCAQYHRFKCLARVTTRIIGGYEMMKVNCGIHTHGAPHWHP